MLAGALTKAAALGVMVYIRMRVSLPQLIEEALQGEPWVLGEGFPVRISHMSCL